MTSKKIEHDRNRINGWERSSHELRLYIVHKYTSSPYMQMHLVNQGHSRFSKSQWLRQLLGYLIASFIHTFLLCCAFVKPILIDTCWGCRLHQSRNMRDQGKLGCWCRCKDAETRAMKWWWWGNLSCCCWDCVGWSPKKNNGDNDRLKNFLCTTRLHFSWQQTTGCIPRIFTFNFLVGASNPAFTWYFFWGVDGMV